LPQAQEVILLIPSDNFIYEIVGKQGSGKTLLMTSMATHLYKPAGYTICTNLKSYKYNDMYFSRIEDIKKFEPDLDKKYLFLLDEVMAYSNLDSRMSMSHSNVKAIKVLTQLRKKNISMMYTLQFLGNDKRFRDITDEVFFIPDKLLYPQYKIDFKSRRVYYAKGYFLVGNAALQMENKIRYYHFYNDDIENYDTHEIIEGEENDE
jgi:cytidylate kinase